MASGSSHMSFGFKPEANGTVVLILSTSDGQELRLTIPIQQVTGFAAAALGSAQLASQLSNLSPPEITTVDSSLSGIPPDKWGIAMGPKGGQVTLVAHYGAAALALPFTQRQASQIGGALMAAGSRSGQGH